MRVSGQDTSARTAEAKAVSVKNALWRLKLTRPNGQTYARAPDSYLQRKERDGRQRRVEEQLRHFPPNILEYKFRDILQFSYHTQIIFKKMQKAQHRMWILLIVPNKSTVSSSLFATTYRHQLYQEITRPFPKKPPKNYILKIILIFKAKIQNSGSRRFAVFLLEPEF